MDVPDLSHRPHLAEVSRSALAALGVGDVTGCSNSLVFPEVAGICVLMIDGLGHEQLVEHAADAPVLNALNTTPLRAGFPSTTSAGFAALSTGLTTGEHGIAGYTFEIPEIGMINMVNGRRDDGMDVRKIATIDKIQPLPTLLSRATEAGVATTVVSAEHYRDSLMSTVAHRGANYVGVRALGDLATGLLDALAATPSLCWAYHGDLDGLGHAYGPGSLAWRLQLRQIDRLVEMIVERLPRAACSRSSRTTAWSPWTPQQWSTSTPRRP